MVHEEEAEPSGRPEVKIDPPVAIVASSAVPHVEMPPIPRGLTEDGRREYERLIGEDTRRLMQRLDHELTLLWIELKVDGPESFGWDRVQKAHGSLHEKERQQIIDEVKARARTEVAQELQQGSNLRRRTRRATQRWVAGTAVSTGSAATIAVMAIPATDLRISVALVAASVVGAVVSWPRG